MRYKNLNKSYAAWKANDTTETRDKLGEDLLGFCHNVVTKYYWKYFYSTFEDAVDESCLQIWRDIDKYDSTKSLFTTWAQTIVIHRCNTIFEERKNRREQLLVGYEERPSKGLSLVNQITLANLVNKLSPEDQEFVCLKMQGLSNEELAEHYKTSVGAAKMRYYRIIKELQTFVR